MSRAPALRLGLASLHRHSLPCRMNIEKDATCKKSPCKSMQKYAGACIMACMGVRAFMLHACACPHTCACAHAALCVRVRACVRASVIYRACVRACVLSCVRARVYTSVRACICVLCVCMYMCACKCMSACGYWHACKCACVHMHACLHTPVWHLFDTCLAPAVPGRLLPGRAQGRSRPRARFTLARTAWHAACTSRML